MLSLRVLKSLLSVCSVSYSSAYSISSSSNRRIRNSPFPLLQTSVRSDSFLIEADGPFEEQPWSDFWTRGKGRTPYLIRNAFDPNGHLAVDAWPTYEDILLELSSTDHSRLIHHQPGNWTSFQVESGPLEAKLVQSFLQQHKTDHSSSPLLWTILVNDVDRYVPELADWIDAFFSSWLPRWRRDDAQMSIATTGGGIGPHVDNYDVFLIQTSGQRRWRISNHRLISISAQDETQLLIPDIPVSVLNITKTNFNDTSTDIVLNPGDCLYLPPRIIHWGTAESDDCVTLSIGCRAPSAKDLVARVSEYILTDGSLHPTAVQRYNNDDSVTTSPHPDGNSIDNHRSTRMKHNYETITTATKQHMKAMVRRAIDAVLDDDDLWDTIVGRLTTEPIRDESAEDVLISYKNEDPEYRERWGVTAEEAIDLIQKSGNSAALIRSPGISLACTGIEFPTTADEDPLRIDRLWACGRNWEIIDCKEAAEVFRIIESGELIDGVAIQAAPENLRHLFCKLLDQGVLQACDLLEPEGDDGGGEDYEDEEDGDMDEET